MTVTLKQLGYFVALAEERSFGRAALRVHVSQPALSQQIRELETQLGATLVERLPRDIRLTRAGDAALGHARTVLRNVAGLEQAVRLAGGLAGRLTLGVIPTVAPYLLPQALALIRARGLTLDLRVREAQAAALLGELAEGALDAAVVALPVSVPGLVAEPLFTDRFLLAGSAEGVAAQGAGPEPRGLPRERLLLLDAGHCLADQAREACGFQSGPSAGPGAASLATLCGLVAEGFGLTFLPEIAVRAETGAAPGLRLSRFAAPEPAREIALVRRPGQGGGDWAAELAGLLREAAAQLIEDGRAAAAGAAG